MDSARSVVAPIIAVALLCAAAAKADDISFTGTANPTCFTAGGEGTVTVKAKNTLGHETDALVMAACAAFEGQEERPSWIVEKTFQTPTDPLKLPTVFLYEFNDQNCIRAQPSAPGGSWPANKTETVTFTFRVPESIDATTLVLHDTAWSQEAPKDKEIRLPECGAPPAKPHLKIEKFPLHGEDAAKTLYGYRLEVQNDGGAITSGEVIIRDAVPAKLKVLKAWAQSRVGGSHHELTPLGQTVEFRPTQFADHLIPYFVFIFVEPKPGVSGEVLNSAFVCGGGDSTAPCSNARESNVVLTNLPKPTGPPPGTSVNGAKKVSAGTAATYSASASSLASTLGTRATAVSYVWLLSDVPLLPAATGSSLVHTFAKAGNEAITLLAFANGTRSRTDFPVEVTNAAPGCTPDAGTLCLLGGRFKVQADWQALNNSTNGAASARPITSDTGAFWFFDAANLELIVKLIDGRGLNGRFWVFFGALSDVQYQVKVTDTQTGQVRQYVNGQGDLTSFADTAAFPLAAGASAADDESFVAFDTGFIDPTFGEDLAGLWSPVASCIADPNTKKLCLSDRFDISVTCTAPGTACTPTPVKLTADTGYFWFFNNANGELMTKVVDGRGLNGKFWFFYGALSDVQYKIRLTDRVTGKFKEYVNAQGNLASVADTSAITP